jgi:hypothetical protein
MLKAFAVVGLSVALALGVYAGVKGGEKKTLTGYVVDAMCAKGMAKSDNPMEKAAKHTKGCALEEGCAASGFGVFSDGKYTKFDDAGDAMAKDLIIKSKTEKGMMVEVTGEMMGEKLAVSSIKEHMADAMMDKKDTEMEKKEMEKKDE